MQPAKTRSSTDKLRGQGAKPKIDQELIDDQKFQQKLEAKKFTDRIEREELQRLIRYRHRIVHVSPLLGILNEDRISQGESPLFANRGYGSKAMSVTSEFVTALHEATLKLRP